MKNKFNEAWLVAIMRLGYEESKSLSWRTHAHLINSSRRSYRPFHPIWRRQSYLIRFSTDATAVPTRIKQKNLAAIGSDKNPTEKRSHDVHSIQRESTRSCSLPALLNCLKFSDAWPSRAIWQWHECDCAYDGGFAEVQSLQRRGNEFPRKRRLGTDDGQSPTMIIQFS